MGFCGKDNRSGRFGWASSPSESLKTLIVDPNAKAAALAYLEPDDLAVLVFPVALFAFGDHFDGLVNALVSCFWALGFGDPFYVFALAAGAEVGEDFAGGFVGFEGLG